MTNKLLIKASAAVSLAIIGALPAVASVHIKPIYTGDQVWTGYARVSFWNDGRGKIVVKYPTLNFCAEAKDVMISAMAGNPGAGMFGKHKRMNRTEVNSLIRKFSNSPPYGYTDSPYRLRSGLTAVKYPSRAFECGSGSNPRDRCPEW